MQAPNALGIRKQQGLLQYIYDINRVRTCAKRTVTGFKQSESDDILSVNYCSMVYKSLSMQVYPLCLVIWSAFESVLCTACIYGWPQLLEILESERYFSSYCKTDAINSSDTLPQINTRNSSNSDDDSGTCSKQDSLLILSYTLSLFTFFTTTFFSGKSLDIFGFRKTRVLAW